MNISVIVATFGSADWQHRGITVGRSLEAQEASEVLVLHGDGHTLAGVRNEAASLATGDWLLFVDADDALKEGYVAAMRAVMRRWNLARPGDLRENPLLLVPAVTWSRGVTVETAPTIPAWDRSLLDLNCAVIGTLIPRYLFLELGGFREFASLEDFDLWLRAVAAGARMVPVRDAIYRARQSSGGRNEDQSPYHRIRAEHRPKFDWANVSGYKVES